jgi:hypothetical protein
MGLDLSPRYNIGGLNQLIDVQLEIAVTRANVLPEHLRYAEITCVLV